MHSVNIQFCHTPVNTFTLHYPTFVFPLCPHKTFHVVNTIANPVVELIKGTYPAFGAFSCILDKNAISIQVLESRPDDVSDPLSCKRRTSKRKHSNPVAVSHKTRICVSPKLRQWHKHVQGAREQFLCR